MRRVVAATLAMLCILSVRQAAYADYRLLAISEGAFSRPHDVVLSENSRLLYVAGSTTSGFCCSRRCVELHRRAIVTAERSSAMIKCHGLEA